MRPDPAGKTTKGSALQLWWAYPDDLLRAEAAEACAALLSDDERERWQRFRFEHTRREYLATHALARTALARFCGAAPEELRFVPNAHGKPALEPDCGVRFNLSNSAGLVVCFAAAGSAEVGVDVESFARAGQIAAVAHKVLSAQERMQLEALPEDERRGRVLSLWTLKEAYIKARGMGMSLPMHRASFLFDAAGAIRLELEPSLRDDARRWRFCLVDHAQHRIALMVEGAALRVLEVWEARPPSGTPVPLKLPAGAWFCAPRG
jgi:4'-phosphopantetheinyl transferase